MRINTTFMRAKERKTDMRKTYLAVLAGLVALSITACQPKSTQEPSGTQATVQETTEAKVEVDLSELQKKVQEAYGENYIPSADYDEQAMNDLFGITKDMYQEYIAQGPMISVHVDTFVAVKAAEGKADAVEEALKAYRDKQINDSVQYPMNLPKVNSSQVVRHGDYVFFVMLGTPSEEAELKGEDEALESAKENNQIAVDVIDSFFKA